MNNNKINLKIITPDGVISTTQESKIFFCGELGVFELLPNHENYISTLKEGVISICKKENFAPYFIVSKAFMKFDNSSNTCEVIGDYAINISEVKNLKKDYINEIILNSHYEDEKSFYKFISQYLLQ